MILFGERGREFPKSLVGMKCMVSHRADSLALYSVASFVRLPLPYTEVRLRMRAVPLNSALLMQEI